MLKKLTTKLSINLFLSSSFTSEEMEEISDLMTKHWHGIISVPVRIPLVMWKSGYSKALDAKVGWRGGGASGCGDQLEICDCVSTLDVVATGKLIMCVHVIVHVLTE